MTKSPKKLLFMVWGWLAVPGAVTAMVVGFWLNV